jgi:hypothetical protein
MSNYAADTIIHQLGGNRALTMMGVTRILKGYTSAHLHVGKNAKKVSVLVIKLDRTDTYTVEFWTGKGIHCKLLDTVSGVYWDSLKSVVESGTGMYLSL